MFVKDPATDFRGMGLLGLQNLVYFAKNRQEDARSVLLCARSPKYEYPFSIAGINLTAMILKMVEARKLSLYFYTLSEEQCIRCFNDLYCDIFVRFNSFWVASEPVDVMDFGKVQRKFAELLEYENVEL